MSCFLRVIGYLECQSKTYRCDQVRNLKEKWKEECRKNYGTEKLEALGLKDSMYEEYCKSLDEFLGKCKCKK